METMNTVIGVLGSILIAAGGYLISFGGHKTSSIWVMFAGVVLLLLSGALYLHGKTWMDENLLLPADDKTPEILPGFPPEIRGANVVPDGDGLIFLGPLAISTAETSFAVLKLYGEPLLSISKVESGIRVSAQIWAKDRKIIAVLENNRFRVNPNNTFDVKRPDKSTLEVRDEFNERVLYVRFLNPGAIRVEGVFRSSGRFPVTVTADHLIFGPMVLGPTIGLHLSGVALLDWPSNDPADFAAFDTISVNDVRSPRLRLEAKDVTTAIASVVNLNGKRLVMTTVGKVPTPPQPTTISGSIFFRDPESTAPIPEFVVPHKP